MEVSLFGTVLRKSSSESVLKMSELRFRFLTEAEKQDILSEWENTKQRWRRKKRQGVGDPDAAIVPWCDWINDLPGICTLQSCAGHKDANIVRAGHFWLWMSRNVATRFDRNAFLLLRNQDLIEWISWHYLHEGKKIASITFAGNERGTLEKATSLICGFLCGIADTNS